ncbi:hypothetical protein [Wenzhouxiangella limi]|uniref:Uncharacterized protein n=1 Tax=Wenzhouxiangella limi TaxID=2707351 RepID=A0A845UZE5_9GAMM|nr:hypothetical protein [Wenzhouxiangella limi]NDY95290.1 hypothetical protein [Wenzhouxiangella limi]
MFNLVHETKLALSWVWRVLAAFFRVRPWTTAALISAFALKNIFSLLAGFLPLKVILLAGSDGVPRYFRFFMPVDADKVPWIIGFSAAAVIFFLLVMVMEAVAKKLSATGSYEVLQGANELAVASKQREEAGGYFSQFSEIAANVVIASFALTLLAAVNLAIFVTFTGLLLLEYLFTAGVMAFTDPLKPGAIRKAIQSKVRNYLGLLFSLNFLACFFVLLVPFLTGVGGNLLLAILTLLLLRQASGAVGGIIQHIRKLWTKRAEVSPLVFREERTRESEKLTTRELRLMFAPRLRTATTLKRLKATGIPVRSVESCWQDPKIRGAYTFHVKAEMEESVKKTKVRHFQHQVFPVRQLHLLEHEEFLFSRISRKSVRAPLVLSRYEDEPFACQVCEYGTGKIVDVKGWQRKSLEVLEELWCLDLSRELISAYRTAHPGLEARLLPEFLQRLEVVLESASLQHVYHTFLDALPRLHSVVSQVPLHLHNPDMTNSHVVLDDDDQPLIMTWTRWQLLPLGSALPANLTRELLKEMLERVCLKRKIDPDSLLPAHLLLVRDCQKLEDTVKREHYRSAFSIMESILANELVLEAIDQ